MAFILDENLLNQNIVSLLGIGALPDEEKALILEKAGEVVEKQVLLRLLDSMNEEDARQVRDLEATPSKLQEFLLRRFPNLMSIVEEEIVKVKTALLAAAQPSNA